MANPSTDPWIASNSPLSVERLHAIGLISYRWNYCEFWFFQLFTDISGYPENEAWALVYDLGDRAIWQRINTLMGFRNYDPKLEIIIENACQAYDRCRENRNTIIHSWSHAAGSREDMLVRKSRKANQIEPVPFPSDLKRLRRVADEIETVTTRLWLLVNILDGLGLANNFPLPDILPLPDALGNSPQVPAKPKRQPRPSAASRRLAAHQRKAP